MVLYSNQKLRTCIFKSSFKKNKNTGVKIMKIGKIILKKTIKEIDNLINNEVKKT